MKDLWRRGIAAIVYISFLFCALPVTPRIIEWLKSVTSPAVFSRFAAVLFSLITAFGGGWFLLAAIRKQKVKNLLALLPALPVLCAIILFLEPSPVEKVHIVEYAFLAYLFIRFFSSLFCNTGKITAAAVLVSVTLVALCDEIIQGILPNRFYDIRDIWMNILSGAAILLVWAVLNGRARHNQEDREYNKENRRKP